MKKMFAMVLTVILLLGCLSACGSKGVTLQDVKNAGKLTVATSPDFPPFENLENGEVVGIEIEILELVCKELGVKLDIQQIDFDSVLNGIQAGKYDVGAAGISVDPGREKNMLFTTPYCLAAQAIVVPENSAVTSKADLTGKKIAVQTGTTAEKFCMSAGYEIKSYTANSDAELALTSGKVDAWVIDDLTAADMVAAYNAGNPEVKLMVLDDAMTTEPYAFAFTHGSEELVNAINEIIEKLLADGTIAGIFEKFEAPYTAPGKQ